jgi:hypothetical protein|tara:strand:- start:328 stop:528 length:201 start_codon:yes stop_codon:yes gene_type:complete
MQIGDLVWHVDDLACNDEIPGVVTCLFESSAIVHFVDRSCTEEHVVGELIADLDNWDEEENIMGNP